VAGDASSKPRTKEYEGERIAAWFKGWPGLGEKLILEITNTDCSNRAAKYSASANYHASLSVVTTVSLGHPQIQKS